MIGGHPSIKSTEAIVLQSETHEELPAIRVSALEATAFEVG